MTPRARFPADAVGWATLAKAEGHLVLVLVAVIVLIAGLLSRSFWPIVIASVLIGLQAAYLFVLGVLHRAGRSAARSGNRADGARR